MGVHHFEERHKICRVRKLLNKRAILAERPQQFAQVFLRHKQQRLRPEHLQVALEEYVLEQFRFRLELCSETLHELAVLLRILALNHHHEIVLFWKFLFELKEILVITLLRTDEVVAARVELEVFNRVPDGADKEKNLGVEEPARIPNDRPRQDCERSPYE